MKHLLVVSYRCWCPGSAVRESATYNDPRRCSACALVRIYLIFSQISVISHNLIPDLVKWDHCNRARDDLIHLMFYFILFSSKFKTLSLQQKNGWVFPNNNSPASPEQVTWNSASDQQQWRDQMKYYLHVSRFILTWLGTGGLFWSVGVQYVLYEGFQWSINEMTAEVIKKQSLFFNQVLFSACVGLLWISASINCGLIPDFAAMKVWVTCLRSRALDTSITLFSDRAGYIIWPLSSQSQP